MRSHSLACWIRSPHCWLSIARPTSYLGHPSPSQSVCTEFASSLRTWSKTPHARGLMCRLNRSKLCFPSKHVNQHKLRFCLHSLFPFNSVAVRVSYTRQRNSLFYLIQLCLSACVNLLWQSTIEAELQELKDLVALFKAASEQMRQEQATAGPGPSTRSLCLLSAIYYLSYCLSPTSGVACLCAKGPKGLNV